MQEKHSREDGAEGLPQHVRLRRLLGRFRRRFELDVFDVFTRPVPPDPVFEAPPGYTFRWGSAEDVQRCDPYHTELDERERREGVLRLALGHRVVLGVALGVEPGVDAGLEPEPGVDRNVAVFSMWVNPRNLNVPDLVKRKLTAGQWFIYKAFTSPDHRGRKLYEAGMQFVLAEMARQELSELVGYAHVKKSVSRKGLARLSFESAGRLLSVRVPGWQGTFLSRRLEQRFPESVPRSNALTTSNAGGIG